MVTVRKGAVFATCLVYQRLAERCVYVCTTLQALWAEGGVSRFYRGFSPCIMRAAPANAVMLYTVDKVSHLLAGH
jgi:hypothetical protein